MKNIEKKFTGGQSKHKAASGYETPITASIIKNINLYKIYNNTLTISYVTSDTLTEYWLDNRHFVEFILGHKKAATKKSLVNFISP